MALDLTTLKIHQDLKGLPEGANIVVFSGAGMSADSGISTFRDSGGLWEQYRIEDVATPEAFERQPKEVLDFYNKRRRQLLQAKPNEGHRAIAKLQEHFQLQVVTQNIDDLHERAGSDRVIHLHGELRKARSTADPELVYPLEGADLNMGMLCEKGSQLRPHVVWFGELVPMMEVAEPLFSSADLVITVGTSLQVYPAAGLVAQTPPQVPKLVIDPASLPLDGYHNIAQLPATASEGMAALLHFWNIH